MFSLFGKNKKDSQKNEDEVEEFIDEFKKAAIRKMDQSTQDKIHKGVDYNSIFNYSYYF